MKTQARDVLSRMFEAAVQAAQPSRVIGKHLPEAVAGRVIVIGAGKASAAMAQAFEQCWDGPLEGLVVTAYGHAVPCERIRVVEAAHPTPDQAGREAAQQTLGLVKGLSPDDLVVCLFSGGASSLLPLPGEGVTLEDKQAINRALLTSGASISEMNCVRRHLSGIKGGRLAAACHPAKVVNLLISDVPGDQPMDIGSGPTVADPTTCDDALAIVQRYAIDLPPGALDLLQSGRGETIKPDDARLASVRTTLVATPHIALTAAADVAAQAGLGVCILGDSIEGESREVAKVMAGIALQVRRHGQPLAPPCVLLSGGETTVTVRGKGRGGRNVEFLLSLALALKGAKDVYAVAGDTDGVDGLEPNAGGYLAPDSLARARALGLRPGDFLDNNDGHGFFEALDDALVTGPTLTNVNDFRAILIL